jgi:hypothetical protein
MAVAVAAWDRFLVASLAPIPLLAAAVALGAAVYAGDAALFGVVPAPELSRALRAVRATATNGGRAE